jgi:hypothetical protein
MKQPPPPPPPDEVGVGVGVLVGVGVGVELANQGTEVEQVPVLLIVPPVVASLIPVIVCPVNNWVFVKPVANCVTVPVFVVPDMLKGPAT